MTNGLWNCFEPAVDEEQAQREAEGRKRRGKEPAPVDATPEDKAQTNFTDPEAKVMKQSNKGNPATPFTPPRCSC